MTTTGTYGYANYFDRTKFLPDKYKPLYQENIASRVFPQKAYDFNDREVEFVYEKLEAAINVKGYELGDSVSVSNQVRKHFERGYVKWFHTAYSVPAINSSPSQEEELSYGRETVLQGLYMKLDDFAWIGEQALQEDGQTVDLIDPSYPIHGVINNPDITYTDVGTAGNWATASGVEIYDQILALYMEVSKAGNDTYAVTPNTLLVSAEAYNQLLKQYGAYYNKTVLSAISEAIGNLSIIPAPKLLDKQGNKRLCLMYNRNSDYLYQMIGLLPDLKENDDFSRFSRIVVGFAKCGGITVIRPETLGGLIGI